MSKKENIEKIEKFVRYVAILARASVGEVKVYNNRIQTLASFCLDDSNNIQCDPSLGRVKVTFKKHGSGCRESWWPVGNISVMSRPNLD
jgi:hypothetical protein